MKAKDRIYGIDILRIIAVVLVLILHFFTNTYYNSSDLSNLNMKGQTIIRDFAMICVPLFMVITGFLNKKIQYDKSFFQGIIQYINCLDFL